MKKKSPLSVLLARALMALVTILPAAAFAGSHDTLVFIVNGPSVANTQPAPNLPAFDAWCASTCSPSTQMPLYDAQTGKPKGYVYTWATPFEMSSDGASFCFSEFAEFALDGGSLYVHSGQRGTCGAFIDPALKAGTHSQGAQVVGAGGDGIVVGGTYKFRGWVGTYTDRLFSEINPSGGGYYDQLFWSISARPPTSGERGGSEYRPWDR